MSNPYSAQPNDFPASDSDRLRTLLDNLNNLKSKLHHFTVIDELGQPLGEITDLILDEGHQLNLVLALADAGLGGSPVLLNGRRIKKVSVQTQSVFVDITKADTQFLPEYSSTAIPSSLPQSDQPLDLPSLSEPLAELNFADEPAPSISSYAGESFTYPTTADRELAESLFNTEPGELDGIESSPSSQEWELSTSTSTEDVFGSWTEESTSLSDLNLLSDQNLDLSDAVSFPASPELNQTLAEDLSGLELSSSELFGSPEAFSLAEPAVESSNFSFAPEPTSDNLASELDRLDLGLDNDWSQLGNVSETADTSSSFELSLESETFTQSPPGLGIDDMEGAIADSIVPDQSVNPFAGELPSFSDDLSFDLPASATVSASEPALLELGELDPAFSSASPDLSLEWNEAAQVLEFDEPLGVPTAEAMSLADLGEPDANQPDTIQSLTDLDLFAEDPGRLAEPEALNDFTPSFVEDTFAEETSSPVINYDYEPPAPPVVHESENQDAWLTAAGAGAAGLAAGVAGSSIFNEEPAELAMEEFAPAPVSDSPDAILPLLEEQLEVEYQRRKVGEVIIRKQIETRMVQVPVRYEKLIIEQVSPERKSLAEVDLSQGALDNIELTGVEQKPTVSGDFASPAVASQALDAIAKALQNRCKRVRIEIELEDGQMQQAYQDWFDECSQL